MTGLIASSMGLFGTLGVLLAGLILCVWFGVLWLGLSAKLPPVFEAGVLGSIILLAALVLPLVFEQKSFLMRDWGRHASLLAFLFFLMFPALWPRLDQPETS